MVAIKLELVLFLNIFYVSHCLRRIKGGATVASEKTYVVYLVKAPTSDKTYDAWLCGGALVSSLFIITSAACVDDVEYMYAIAGYKKYVPDDQINVDPCTSEKKKKVIYTCIPTKYELDYNQVDKWSFIDIALVKVESAYDLADASFKTVCSYIPTVIPINYETKFQKPGTDALVYGWGHLEFWRQASDTANYNQEVMRYASTKIIDKDTCKKQYDVYPNMGPIIDQYMICTLEKGEINEVGELVLDPSGAPKEKLNGCNQPVNLKPVNATDTQTPVPLLNPEDCIDEYGDIMIDVTRRKDSNQASNKSLSQIRTLFNKNTERSRKNGICQNDHGGPLVTWVGGKEVLIGIASVFRVSEDSRCMGPYLYTSTQCTGAFLDCILTNSIMPNAKGRRAICDSPPIKRGYDTVERYISWRNHPDGPADNEMNAINIKYDSKIEKKLAQLKKIEALQKLIKYTVWAKKAYNQTFAVRPQRPLQD